MTFISNNDNLALYSAYMTPQTIPVDLLNDIDELSVAYNISAIVLLKVAIVITLSVEERALFGFTYEIVKNVFEHRNFEFLDSVSAAIDEDRHLVLSVMHFLYDMQGKPKYRE